MARIRLTHEWCRKPAGTVLELPPAAALELVQRGVAVVDRQAGGSSPPGESAKEIEQAPADKMIRGATKTKRRKRG